MKLSNIFNLIKEEEEEDGMQQLKVRYDLAIQPSNLNAALDALENISNYGIYAQNLRDPKTIAKVFGPSIPAQKAGAAWKDWDSRSNEEKEFKLVDIKKRVPEEWTAIEAEAEPGYEMWQAEGNDGDLTDYFLSLTGKQLPKSLVGKYGKNYFPMKTPDNLKKYSGKLEQDIHYVVKNDKIIFPSSLENPYKTKPYLSKVLKTIMDTAGLEYTLVDVEQDTVGDEAPVAIEKPQKDVVPPLSYTADTRDKVEKARGIFQKEIGEVPTAKYEIEAVETPEGRKYKLVVTGISADQRAKLFNRKTTLNENFDFEKYQMLRRAGIIK